MKVKDTKITAQFSCNVKSQKPADNELLDKVQSSINLGAATLRVGRRSIVLDATYSEFTETNETDTLQIFSTLEVDGELKDEGDEDLTVEDLFSEGRASGRTINY